MFETDKVDLLALANYPANCVLPELLQDKSTGRNIIFATDAYGTDPKAEITLDWLLSDGVSKIQPRVAKSLEEQSNRTRRKAEVFTPSWLCNKMNNFCDEVWFARKCVFNKENERNWQETSRKIEFGNYLEWEKYVTSPRLEITCGEAPYLVSRYDTVTGEILEISHRVGLLDRKLRVVTENTTSETEWLMWAECAFQSVYGYEFQGDNLLIARINLLNTFSDYLEHCFSRKVEEAELKHFANIIAWNVWQMDGITGSIPFTKPVTEVKQRNLFEIQEEKKQINEVDCLIYDWLGDKPISYSNIRKGKEMKFDFVIGNPPYQQEAKGTSKNTRPIYHYFYKQAFQIGDKVELISPGRFLFRAGATPEDWNEEMLNDPHLKVLFYEQDSSKVFAGQDIKGGVVITYRDKNKNFGAIGTFTSYQELNSILSKVRKYPHGSLSSIISNRGLYRYSEKAYTEEPMELLKTSDKRISTQAFECMPKLFTEHKPEDGHEYVQLLGNINRQRVYRWFRKDFIEPTTNLYKYKVLVPKANGSGAIGEVLSTPLIGTPLIGFTETYISIGATDNIETAEAILKFIKTKFARILLGVLKITQDNSQKTWKYVPLQDFTSNSDIDWTKSVAEIDRQLYAKYHLTEEEISFIETKVKEMN